MKYKFKFMPFGFVSSISIIGIVVELTNIILYGNEAYPLYAFIIFICFAPIVITAFISGYVKVNNDTIELNISLLVSKTNYAFKYSEIISIHRNFWFYEYWYFIAFRHHGKTRMILVNTYSRYKQILAQVIPKVDKSIVEDGVYKKIMRRAKSGRKAEG
jgi:hypothetical protein